MARRTPAPRNPFRYGALAIDDAFADREAEVQELKFDLNNGQDVVVFAPRRYGKSSLVWRAAVWPTTAPVRVSSAAYNDSVPCRSYSKP